MSALIVSCGRTGTNMLLETLRATKELTATSIAEDKQVFRRGSITKNYLSKTDTVYIDNLRQVKNLLDSEKELKILWTIRDLRDCAMSKIYRGQPGNDCNGISDDATFQGCLDDIVWMQTIHHYIKENYPDRIFLVRLENMLNDFEGTVKSVCKFIGIEYIDDMKNFTSRYRNNFQARRYKGLDKKQFEMYKRRDEVYNGFFKTHDIDLDLLFVNLIPCLNHFGYSI